MKVTIIIYIIFCSVINGDGIKDKVENRIRNQFNGSKIELTKYKISNKIKSNIERKVKQRFFKNYVFYWKILKDGKLNGVALLDNVYGKTMPITFLAIYNLEGNIVSVSIIKYREAHGGAVSNKSWLSQFNKKSFDSSFEFGKDIDGISGATISAKAVTKGIEKLTLLAKIILTIE